MRKLLAAALLLAALGTAGQGLWLQGKALLAQVLIAQAWEQQLASGEPAKPWAWADTWPVAKLTAPNGEQSYVLAGLSGQALAFGPGLLDNGVQPGGIGSLVLAGHQDSHFAFVQHLKPGQVLQLQGRDGQTYRYRIASQRVVDSRKENIELQYQRGELRLVTCYPFAALTSGGPQRYVVTASLEPAA
ncbi:class GN sortase [Halopseudomonas sabulinigri]|uniref:Class GN sortase n=1 Tax=Halopseudomonas sabulinigri TaxID=472181 RepID=A0ABP9ZP22_9GAMM